MPHQPRGRYFDDFKAGETFVSQARTVEASDKPDRGVVVLDTVVRNQRGEVVLQFEQTVLMLRRK